MFDTMSPAILQQAREAEIAAALRHAAHGPGRRPGFSIVAVSRVLRPRAASAQRPDTRAALSH